MLTAGGDKPLLVQARSPELALEHSDSKAGLDAIDYEIGRAIAVPDSSWHEFVPARGWRKL